MKVLSAPFKDKITEVPYDIPYLCHVLVFWLFSGYYFCQWSYKLSQFFNQENYFHMWSKNEGMDKWYKPKMIKQSWIE